MDKEGDINKESGKEGRESREERKGGSDFGT